MNLEFEAEETDYNEAIDGDIVQVHFQEYPDPDIDYGKKNAPLPPPIKSLGFSANYEFGSDIEVSWCDGEEDYGGLAIKNIDLSINNISVLLEDDTLIKVKFSTDKITYKKIHHFLSKLNPEFR